jgi:para-aminobenzoate synthetase component 1
MLYRSTLPYTSDASAYYAAIADLPWAVWLDSGGRGRYDILSAQPLTTLVTQGAETQIHNEYGVNTSDADPFVLLREQMGVPSEHVPDIKFAGGALGYWVMTWYDVRRTCRIWR